ncbi:MAG TPA: phosphoribosylformylglycinamidine synthase subunit PurS [Nitrososphaerales archaeon]|nr:phosphoribosylformylglycinamidine synthase subunit PurS [Nitrososphaerales archaeon]
MKFRARIEISLKRDYLDPESETVKRTLLDLNFPILAVRTRKVYEIILDAGTKKDAEASARTMCSRLLVNPTKDEFEVEVKSVGSSAAET